MAKQMKLLLLAKALLRSPAEFVDWMVEGKDSIFV